MKNILILANYDLGLYNFRKELIQTLIDQGYNIYISLPYGIHVDYLVEMGCIFVETPIDRRGVSIKKDYKLYRFYKKMIKNIKPFCVLSFTIKPNIYGGIVCRILKTAFFPNITGLGSGVRENNLLKKTINVLYKLALKKANTVFVQNNNDLKYFHDKKIIKKNYILLPGSGVNLNQIKFYEYPTEENGIHFNFIGRIMPDKGIDEFLFISKKIKKIYPNTFFHIWGVIEKSHSYLNDVIKHYEENELIIYHGEKERKELIAWLQNSHCVIHPSYSEGMSNALLEAAAVGRPLIASNIPGCKEVIEHSVNGFLFEVKNTEDLFIKINQFMKLTFVERKEMGLASRRLVEKKFNRDIVTLSYMKEINKLL